MNAQKFNRRDAATFEGNDKNRLLSNTKSVANPTAYECKQSNHMTVEILMHL